MILLDKKELLDVAENFLLVASQVATLFLMMGVGYVLAKTSKLTRDGLAQMTYLLLYVVVPCLMIDTLQIPCSAELMRVMGLCMALTLGLYLLMALGVCLLFRLVVPAAVQLQGQVGGGRKEIQYVRPKGLLPAEAGGMPPEKLIPQLLLLGRGALSQLPRPADQAAV